MHLGSCDSERILTNDATIVGESGTADLDTINGTVETNT